MELAYALAFNSHSFNIRVRILACNDFFYGISVTLKKTIYMIRVYMSNMIISEQFTSYGQFSPVVYGIGLLVI